MSKRKPTQALPKESPRKGAPDGVNSQAAEDATGGSDAGAPYPNPHTGKTDDERNKTGGGFLDHGGQSLIGYHGTGRLGHRKTKPEGNPNSASGQDD